MNDECEDPEQQPEGDDGDARASALESAEGYVARGAGAGCSGDAGGKEFSASFNAIVEWAEARKLIRLWGEVEILGRRPDAAGHEHEAWFDEASNRWFKATYPNKFGLAWGRGGSATPLEYLRRLILQNRYFGDDIQLVALINSGGCLRVLTSQPHVAGEPASGEEIGRWFRNLGFERLESDGRVAWYEGVENLLVADAHEGNVIKAAGGVPVPIDLNLTQPSGEVYEWAMGAWRAGEAARGEPVGIEVIEEGSEGPQRAGGRTLCDRGRGAVG